MVPWWRWFEAGYSESRTLSLIHLCFYRIYSSSISRSYTDKLWILASHVSSLYTCFIHPADCKLFFLILFYFQGFKTYSLCTTPSAPKWRDNRHVGIIRCIRPSPFHVVGFKSHFKICQWWRSIQATVLRKTRLNLRSFLRVYDPGVEFSSWKDWLGLHELTSDLLFNPLQCGFHPIHAIEIALTTVKNKLQEFLILVYHLVWGHLMFLTALFFLQHSSFLDWVTQHLPGLYQYPRVMCLVSTSGSTLLPCTCTSSLSQGWVIGPPLLMSHVILWALYLLPWLCSII